METSAAGKKPARIGAWARPLAALPAGTLVALITITYTMSYAALIFSGGLATAYTTGLACMLIGCALAGVLTALFSSIPFAVSAPDSNVVSILAAALAPLAWQMAAGGDPAVLAATALAALVLATLVTGLVLGGLGVARAGRLVRFVPFPIVAGFLGASGWLLLAGGANVATDAARPLDLLDPERLPLLLAAGAGALLLLLRPGRLRGPLGLPGLILGGILLHHAAAAALGAGLDAQRATGWLPPVPDRVAFTPPWDPALLALVDWDALARHVADLPLLILVAAIGLLLNVSGVETAAGRDADIDRELRVAGGAALATGLAGGMLGILSPGRSLLMLQAGAPARWGGVTAGLLAGALPLLFPAALGWMPRWILGALLAFLGLDLLRRWVLDSRHHLPAAEWLQVLAVAGLTIGFGFLVGLLAGLLLACGQFIALYSRTSPVRARYDGTAAEGNRARPEHDRAALRALGPARLVLHLQGFLFFGTADRLLAVVREALSGPLRRTHLLLDFREVTGLDGSAGMAFTRLRQIAAARGVTLVLTGLTPRLARNLGPLANDRAIHRLPTLQEGIAWIEDDVLAALPPRSQPPSFADRLAAGMGEADAARFLAALPEEEVPPGQVLMRQDEGSGDMVLLESGEVSIEVRFPDGQSIGMLVAGAGTPIGELGFLLGARRSATVTARTVCRLRRLGREDLARLEQTSPLLALGFHRLMGQLLAERIQDKDRLIAGLVRGLRQDEDI